jgi:hypothetical protein
MFQEVYIPIHVCFHVCAYESLLLPYVLHVLVSYIKKLWPAELSVVLWDSKYTRRTGGNNEGPDTVAATGVGAASANAATQPRAVQQVPQGMSANLILYAVPLYCLKGVHIMKSCFCYTCCNFIISYI